MGNVSQRIEFFNSFELCKKIINIESTIKEYHDVAQMNIESLNLIENFNRISTDYQNK